jgi:hypothetical protein
MTRDAPEYRGVPEPAGVRAEERHQVGLLLNTQGRNWKRLQQLEAPLSI